MRKPILKHGQAFLGILLSITALISACSPAATGDANQGQPAGSNTNPTNTSAKTITHFSFPTVPATGEISGNDVTVQVPAGTTLTALRAVVLIDGASLKVAGVTQVSGVTANDFSSAILYTVHAQDGSTADYTVTVTTSSSLKAITYFNFPNQAGVSTISGTSINVSLPYGTNRTNLTPIFLHNGSSIAVGATNQVSGVTANDFSSPVTYRVTAQDASFQDYIVTVTADNPTKEILSYGFGAYTGRIAGNTITIDVPFGTNVIHVTPVFQHNGISAKINNLAQVSNSTTVDLSTPKIYTITAQDGTTRDYTVTANVGLDTSKEITGYSIPSLNAVGIINGNAITVNVPHGTNVSNLVAVFSKTGSSVAVGATNQVSGVTANNFTSPVVYTVTAANSSTQNYTVTVKVAGVADKSIELFTFAAAGATGTLNGTQITATVPFGTNVTNLIATFSSTGVVVKVNGVTQTSGITPNNFSQPVVYTIEAADGTMYSYTVTLTVAAASSMASLAYFTFTTTSDFGLFNGTNIAVRVPTGTDLTNLVGLFKINGNVVKVNGVTQFSGVTPNNFSSPVTYAVQAQDGTIVNYTVTVTTVGYDVFAPRISQVTASPSSTSTYPATITVRIYYNEAESGYQSASFQLCSPSRLVSFSSGSALMSGSMTNHGSYVEGIVTIQNYHESGLWKVCQVSVHDLGGNISSLSLVGTVSTTNYTRFVGGSALDSGVAIGGGLMVSGTSHDVTAPDISSISVTPASTSTYPATVTVRINYTETQSGYNYASFQLCSPSRLVSYSAGSLITSGSMTNHGTYVEGSVTIQNYHESGAWKVCQVNMQDNAGNSIGLSYASSVSTTNFTRFVNGNSIDSGVAIGSGVNVTGTSHDVTAPEITSITVTPTATSTYPANVTVRIYFTETGSGYYYASFQLCSPTRLITYSAGTSLMSGSMTNQGAYVEGTVSLQSFHETGIWKVCQVNVQDLAGNSTGLSLVSSVSTTNYTKFVSGNSIDSGVAVAPGVNKQ